jgi:hypothetical protein
MAASTTSNLSGSLKAVYAPKFWAAMQDNFTPILSDLEECPDEPIKGTGWNFPFHLQSPQAWKLNSEGGSVDTFRQRVEVQGTVNATEFVGGFQITELLKNVGKDAGAFGNELDRHVNETAEDVTKGMQRMFTLSHGTGRLAVVQTTTSTVNTFVGKLNEGVVGLMEGDLIDVYDADTSGSVQLSARSVDAINRQTRTVTFSGATASLTADWGVYKSGSYGRTVNGLRGLVDNATYAASIHGQSRATYPALNAQVRDLAAEAAGNDLTEDAMRRICDDIYRVGGYVDRIVTNVGGVNAFLAISDGDRRYNMERGKTAQRVLGYREGDLLFSYHNGNLPIKINPNIPAREMFFLTWKNGFQKHTTRKLGWLEGENGSVLHLTPGSASYATSHIAIICAQVNISCRSPRHQGVIRGFKDASVAGDSLA